MILYYKDQDGMIREHTIVHAIDAGEALKGGLFSSTPEGARQVIPLKELAIKPIEEIEENKVLKESDPDYVAKSWSEEETAEEDDLLEAVRSAARDGKVTNDGKPLVGAIEEILGRDITSKERDEAWEKISDGK